MLVSLGLALDPTTASVKLPKPLEAQLSFDFCIAIESAAAIAA
ncbi:hypothetical protein [Trichocoleus desertorum]